MGAAPGRVTSHVPRASASLTAAAMWTSQNDTRILMRLWPPELWNAAHALSMAERDVLSVAAEGRPEV